MSNFLLYLFQFNPGHDFGYYLHVTIYAICLVMAGIISKGYCRKDKTFRRLFKNHTSTFFYLAGLIFFLVWARYYNVSALSMRALLYSSILVSIYFILKMAFKFRDEYGKLKKFHNQKKNEVKKTIYSHKKKRK